MARMHTRWHARTRVGAHAYASARMHTYWRACVFARADASACARACTEKNSGRKILATVSKQYGKKSVDKESIFVRKMIDDKEIERAEAQRLRNASKREGARRRAGVCVWVGGWVCLCGRRAGVCGCLSRRRAGVCVCVCIYVCCSVFSS